MTGTATLQLLLTTAGKVALLLVLAAAARSLLARRSAATRHLCALIGLAAVLALPLAERLAPRWTIATFAPPAPRAEPVSSPAASPTAVRAATPGPIDRAGSAPVAVPPRRASLAAAEPISTSAGAPLDIPWVGLLAALWLAGTTLLLLRLAAGIWRTARISAEASAEVDPRATALVAELAAALGWTRGLRVLGSSRVPVAMVWGGFRPTLLLPDDHGEWSDERLRVVLSHELAHVVRYDWLALVAGRIAVALHWFQPLAWVLESAARRDREEACDDSVLTLVERPSDYAGHLLDLARAAGPWRPGPSFAVPFVRASRLEQRLRAILRPGERHRPPTRRSTVVATAAAVALLLAVASVRPVAADREAPSLWTAPGGLSGPVSWPLTSFEEAPQRIAQGPVPEATPEQRLERVEKERTYQRKAMKKESKKLGSELWGEAYSLHRSERYAEAIDLFEQAAELGYRPEAARYNIACAYAGLGDADRALTALEEAAGLGFDISDYLRDDSDLDPIRADPRFRALLDAYPNSKEAKHRRKAEDRLARALREADEVERTRPDDGDAWHSVGRDLLAVRQLDRAVPALERAVALLGENGSTARYNLACALSQAGDVDRALDALERAVLDGFDSDERFENDRDLDPLRATRRFAEIRSLHDDLSMDRFKQESWQGKLWNHWTGDGDYSAERWRPAVEFFQSYTRAHPELGRAWFDLGWALHYSRRHDEAADAFARAGSLGFRPATMAYDVACAEAMAGRKDAAFAALERAADAGFDLGAALHDDDLESLWDDPRFDAIAARAWRAQRERERERGEPR